MFRKNAYALRKSLILAGAIAGSIAIASSAVAGECPADKMKPNVRAMVDFKPVGLTDVTLGSIDLGKQPAHIEGRELRFRKLTIEPGGIVPWHSHDDRPALIFVQQGEIVEYASKRRRFFCTRTNGTAIPMEKRPSNSSRFPGYSVPMHRLVST